MFRRNPKEIDLDDFDAVLLDPGQNAQQVNPTRDGCDPGIPTQYAYIERFHGTSR
jgi:hypothetical protein